MTSLELSALRPIVARVIMLRAGSDADGPAIAAAARRAYDDLAAVFVPLISQTGVDALVARALHLTKREYPLEQTEEETAEPIDRVISWMERQEPTRALAAAAMLLGTFAALLATLIGEPLTTRYLERAWADGFGDTRPESTRP